MSPNPSVEELSLDFSGALDEFISFEIANSNGKTVLFSEITASRVRISTGGMKAGIYMVRVFTRSGGFSKKLLIHQ